MGSYVCSHFCVHRVCRLPYRAEIASLFSILLLTYSNLLACIINVFHCNHVSNIQNVSMPLVHLPVYLIWRNSSHLIRVTFICSAVPHALCPFHIVCVAISDPEGSDSLILSSTFHIYNQDLSLFCYSLSFCSVNVHMLQYFIWACVSVCVQFGKTMMSGIML